VTAGHAAIGRWSLRRRSTTATCLSLARLADQATELIAARWGAVSASAEVLMARGSLDYPEVRRLLGARYPV